MTVSTTNPKIAYAGNGVAFNFTFPFRIFAASDLRVVLRDSAGNETVQVESTHYTLSAAPWTSGGSISMVTPPATGETLLLKFETAATQPVDYTEGDAFPAETHETALDRLTMLIQQLQEEIGRTVTLQEVTALSGLVLPDPASGQVLYSPDGLSLAWAALATLSGVPIPDPVPVANGGTGAANAATARANLAVLGLAGGTLTGALTLHADPSSSLHAATQNYVELKRRSRNRLINGEFIIGQRMTSFNQTVTSGNVYGFDRWTAHGSAGIANVFVQRSGPLGAGGALYSARILRSSGSYVGACYLSQVIEYANCNDLAGRAVTLSFKARRGSGYSEASNSIQARIRSGTVADEGIGGLTAGTWTGILTDASQTFALTTSWQTFSMTATLQAGALEVGVMLGTGSFTGTGTANDWVEFTDVQLELGSVATEFDRRPFAEQIHDCQRYFEKSYDITAQPGAVSSAGYLGAVTNGGGAAYMPICFRQRKRGSPTVTLYNHATGATGTWRDGGAADRAVGTTGIGQAGFTVSCTGAAVNSSVGGHWAADAEL